MKAILLVTGLCAALLSACTTVVPASYSYVPPSRTVAYVSPTYVAPPYVVVP